MEELEGNSFGSWDRWTGVDILVKMFWFVIFVFANIILLVILFYNFEWTKGLFYSVLLIVFYNLVYFKREITKFIKKIFKIRPKIKFGKLKY